MSSRLLFFSKPLAALLLFAHGVHLDTVLEMGRGVHPRLQEDDIHFWKEVSSIKGQDAKKNGKGVGGHCERASADEIEREEADPGHHIDHQAEGYTFGFVVIGW